MRITLTAIFTLLASQVASMDVWFCNEIESLGWRTQTKKIYNFAPETFKFALNNQKQIEFGSSGYFADYTLTVDSVLGAGGIIYASDEGAKMLLAGGFFQYVSVGINGSTMIIAECEKF